MPTCTMSRAEEPKKSKSPGWALLSPPLIVVPPYVDCACELCGSTVPVASYTATIANPLQSKPLTDASGPLLLQPESAEPPYHSTLLPPPCVGPGDGVKVPPSQQYASPMYCSASATIAWPC